MKTQYGHLPIELDPRTGRARMVRGAVDSRPDGRKLRRATDLSNRRPGHAEATRLSGSPAVSPAPSPYRSQLEAKYAFDLMLMKRLGQIDDYLYEAVTLILPGRTRYTPDFSIIVKGQFSHFIEVKGGYFWPKDKIRFREAVAHFRWWKFALAERTRGVWTVKWWNT